MKKAIVFGVEQDVWDDQDVLDVADLWARAVWSQMMGGDINMEINKDTARCIAACA